VLQELVAQGLCPVRQPAVLGPQGLRERVEGVTLLPEPAELGTHLVEGAVLVAGTVLELLSPNRLKPVSAAPREISTETTKSKEKATTS
jgi:hypothetical protein